MSKNNDTAKRFDGKLSSEYELSIQCTPGYMELEEKLAWRIYKEYYDNAMILDIGVGTGITSKEILKSNRDAKIIGIDSEKKMIKQAKYNLSDKITSGQVKLIKSDALGYLLNTKSDSINVVASAYTLHNCSDKYRSKLVKEIFRVLTPRGLFINNDKYAVDNLEEYHSVLAGELNRYKLLTDAGRPDLQFEWTRHEIEDQDPKRIMIVSKAIDQLKNAGFEHPKIIKRIEQYAILTAYKPENK